jgi:probable F420-dependent oxidoreductase
MTDVTPRLSMMLVTFSAEDPGGWHHMVRRAEEADRAGIDRLALSDHVVFGERLEEYADPARGGAKGGRQPTGPDGHWLEPLTVATYLAARTTRVRFATNILLAALRRPVVLAKTAATLDVLSGGRLDLGVGVGWQREEYEAAGLDYGTRGRQLDHTLAVLRALWTEQRVDFSDEQLEFAAIHQMPKPLAPGGVPIWVSGTVNERAMTRLARFGRGWIPWGDDAEDLIQSIPRMRAAVAAAGGDPDPIEVTGAISVMKDVDGNDDPDATFAAVPALRAAGVTDFRLGLRIAPDASDAEDRLRALAVAFRSVVGRAAEG